MARPRQFFRPFPVLAAGMLISVLCLFGGGSLPEGLNSVEAIPSLDLAQAARRLAGGEGFSTGFIRPVALRYSDSFSAQAELTNPPLYILVLAGVFSVFGVSDAVLVLTGAVCFWLSALAARRLGAWAFDERTALLGAFLILVNPALLDSVRAGGPAPFASLLALFFLYALEKGRDSRAWCLAAGAAAGLGYLTRYSFGLWLIPAAALLWFAPGSGRRARLGFLGAGALLAASPWLIRNLVVVGNPFFSLEGFRPYMFSAAAPGWQLWRGFSGQSLAVSGKTLLLARRLLLGLRDFYPAVLFFTGSLTAVFALGSVLVGLRERAGRWRALLLSMLGCEFLHQAFFSPSWSGLTPLVPAGLVLAAAAFWGLVGSRPPRTRAAALVGLLLLGAIPLSRPFLPGPGGKGLIYDVPNIRAAAAGVGEKALMVSDIPWAVSWYGNRNALWLPGRVVDFEEINLGFSPPLEAFYITGFYFSSYFHPDERASGWDRLLTSGWLPEGWNLRHRTLLPGGQLLLTLNPYRESFPESR